MKLSCLIAAGANSRYDGLTSESTSALNGSDACNPFCPGGGQQNLLHQPEHFTHAKLDVITLELCLASTQTGSTGQ